MGLSVVESSKDVVNEPKKKHFEGPAIPNQSCQHQYKQVYHNGVFFSCSRDNCVQINDSFYLIRNIVVFEGSDETMLVVERFLRTKDYFTYPLNSSDLGIVKASNLSRRLELKQLGSIQKKYVLFPYKRKFVLVPLGCSKS